MHTEYLVPSSNLANAAREMPRYKCHKMVWALKIAQVKKHQPPAEGAAAQFMLEFVDTDYGPVEVSPDYIAKHSPQAGGYYVVYEDGYKSFSPEHAFETGYAIENIEINLESPREGKTIQLQKRNRATASIAYQTINKVPAGFDVDLAIRKFFGPLDPQHYDYRWVDESDPTFKRPEVLVPDNG